MIVAEERVEKLATVVEAVAEEFVAFVLVEVARDWLDDVEDATAATGRESNCPVVAGIDVGRLRAGGRMAPLESIDFSVKFKNKKFVNCLKK